MSTLCLTERERIKQLIPPIPPLCEYVLSYLTNFILACIPQWHIAARTKHDVLWFDMHMSPARTILEGCGVAVPHVVIFGLLKSPN
jgi:hypothetical protein